MPPAAIIGGIIAGAGSLGGAALESSAAGNAASTQSKAANYAGNLQAQLAQEGLNLQAGQYNNSLGLLTPSAQVGESAGANLANLLGVLPQSVANEGLFSPTPLGTPGIPSIGAAGTGPVAATSPYGLQGAQGTAFPQNNVTGPVAQGPNYGQQFSSQAPSGTGASPITPGGAPSMPAAQGGPPTIGSTINPALGATGSLSQGWNQTFQSPTLQQAEQQPGYQFQLQQGLQALQNSAAAQGGLLSGNTGEALNNYAQNAAQTDYGNVYNQSLQNYMTNYNTFQQNQANEYNRLASLAGLGQVSAQQLQGVGQNFANSSGSLLNTAGQQIGQNLNNAAAATASGYVGSANAYGGALGNLGSSLGGLINLSQILNGGNKQ